MVAVGIGALVGDAIRALTEDIHPRLGDALGIGHGDDDCGGGVGGHLDFPGEGAVLIPPVGYQRTHQRVDGGIRIGQATLDTGAEGALRVARAAVGDATQALEHPGCGAAAEHDVVLGIPEAHGLTLQMRVEGLTGLVPELPQGGGSVVDEVAEGAFLGVEGHIHEELMLTRNAQGIVQRLGAQHARAEGLFAVLAGLDDHVYRFLNIALGDKAEIQSHGVHGLGSIGVGTLAAEPVLNGVVNVIEVSIQLGVILPDDLHHLGEEVAAVPEVGGGQEGTVDLSLGVIITKPVAVDVVIHDVVPVGVVGFGILEHTEQILVGSLNVVGVARGHV